MKDRLIALLKPQVDPNVKLSVVSLFMAKLIESLDGRVVSLEERQLQRGEKGDKGDRGADGKDGKQGVAGPIGSMGLMGPEGKPGADGKTGKAGKAGVSVVDAEIAADDHLVLKLSNGNIIDAGELPTATSNRAGSVFVSGNSYQIAVSATAPSDPQVNDLWLDIS